MDPKLFSCESKNVVCFSVSKIPSFMSFHINPRQCIYTGYTWYTVYVYALFLITYSEMLYLCAYVLHMYMCVICLWYSAECLSSFVHKWMFFMICLQEGIRFHSCKWICNKSSKKTTPLLLDICMMLKLIQECSNALQGNWNACNLKIISLKCASFTSVLFILNKLLLKSNSNSMPTIYKI